MVDELGFLLVKSELLKRCEANLCTDNLIGTSKVVEKDIFRKENSISDVIDELEAEVEKLIMKSRDREAESLSDECRILVSSVYNCSVFCSAEIIKVNVSMSP